MNAQPSSRWGSLTVLGSFSFDSVRELVGRRTVGMRPPLDTTQVPGDTAGLAARARTHLIEVSSVQLGTPSSKRSRGLSAFFLIAGALHFLRPKPYEAIVPPYVPRPREVVAVSGAAEIVGGLSALSPRLDAFTRWWLTGLLLAVFPANVHMAVNPDQIRGPQIPRWLLWARLPIQPLLIAWVWRSTR